MRFLPLPDFDVRATYLACAKGTRNADLQARLVETADQIVASANAYHDAGQNKTWFELAKTVQRVPASDAELRELYDRVMVRQGGAGRQVYDKILTSSGRVCPMCGQGVVNTVDHYLPKSRYAHFSILEANLIPCCRDCNSAKMIGVPASAEDQSFHPYYDDVENDQWLFGRVFFDSGVAIEFYVDAPEGWSPVLAARAQTHFGTFKLAVLYSTFAATELTSLRSRLNELYLFGGAEAVRQDLMMDARSARCAHVNSWRTAMYDALWGSDRFCDNGFVEIGA